MIILLLLLTAALVTSLFFALPYFRQNRWVFTGLLLFIPIFSLSFYFGSERFSAWKKHRAITQEIASAKSDIEEFGKPKQLINQLKEKIKERPDNPKAWYLLARLYFGTGQYKLAIKTFDKAESVLAQTGGPDPSELGLQIQFSKIQTTFVMNKKLSPEQKTFLEDLLTKEPRAFEAINMLALDDYYNQDYDAAIAKWKKLLTQLPKDATSERDNISNMIETAEKAKTR